jgi:hypothetical protein
MIWKAVVIAYYSTIRILEGTEENNEKTIRLEGITNYTYIELRPP